MRPLFPHIEAYNSFWLDVGNGHELYVEESGNPTGYPVIFLHGGPGSGAGPNNRRFFDPNIYRIILLDQRGAGRSRPHVKLEANTTDYLISDIEAVRKKLCIEQWLVFGGSWGATLALLYAQAFPQQVSGLILRGIFLCRKKDIAWLYQYGASQVYPDYWQNFVEQIPAAEQENFVDAYYTRLTGDNDFVRLNAARAWCLWEAQCSSLEPNPKLKASFIDAHHALAMASIEAHYFVHHGFIEENQIIKQAQRIADIPTTIIHGRYDMVCPIEQAYSLHQALPHAHFHIVRNAGHSAFEAGITDNLIKATIDFSEKYA